MVMNAIRNLLGRKPRDATGWTVVPGSEREIDSVVRYCRRMVSRRASMAAGVAVVPLPGIDWLTDIAVLAKLIPDINRAFGLTQTPLQAQRRPAKRPGVRRC